MIFKNGKHYDFFKYMVRLVIPEAIAAFAAIGTAINLDPELMRIIIIILSSTQSFLMIFVSQSKEKFLENERLIEEEWKLDILKKEIEIENLKKEILNNTK